MPNHTRHTFVCFDCRNVVRLHCQTKESKCSLCHKILTHLSYDVRVPKKKDNDGWKLLEQRQIEIIQHKYRRQYEAKLGHSI